MKRVIITLTFAALANLLSYSYAEVLELDEDEEGTPVWKTGQYRDRNEIPLPPNYDEERKHRRALPDSEIATDAKIVKSKKKKNIINRVPEKKGKKSGVPQGFTQDQLKLSAEYSKLDVQTPDRKSEVAKSWGMTYDNLFPEPPKDITGQLRSKLEGGYKIKEEDIDNGMMFRGLGGLMLRDQNHQIVQSKFTEMEDADEDRSARSRVSFRHT